MRLNNLIKTTAIKCEDQVLSPALPDSEPTFLTIIVSTDKSICLKVVFIFIKVLRELKWLWYSDSF